MSSAGDRSQNYYVSPDFLINLDQIAYIERDDRAKTARVVFAAVSASADGTPTNLDLVLRGADADYLIQQITRQPSEDAGMP
jgi:hypothetical protein